MILLIVNDRTSIINMHEFKTEEKVVALLNSGRKTGAVRLLTTDGKISIRFCEVRRAIHEPRVFYKDILINEETFIHVFTKGEKRCHQFAK